MNVPPLPPPGSPHGSGEEQPALISEPLTPPRFIDVPWGPMEAVLVWIIQFVFLGVVVYAAVGGLNGNTQQITAGILTEALAAGLAYAWVRLRFGGGLAMLGLRIDRAAHDFVYGLGVGLGSWLVSVPIVSAITLRLVRTFRNGPVHPPNQIQLKSPGVAALWMFGVIAVVLAPFCEELLYRGFIHQGLRHKLRPWLGSIASGAIFMAAHAPFWLIFPSIFVFGVLQAKLFEKRGSIVSTIAAHMLFNSIGFFAYLVTR